MLTIRNRLLIMRFHNSMPFSPNLNLRRHKNLTTKITINPLFLNNITNIFSPSYVENTINKYQDYDLNSIEIYHIKQVCKMMIISMLDVYLIIFYLLLLLNDYLILLLEELGDYGFSLG